MRILRNIRLVIALIVGIPVALFAAFMGIREYFNGTGTLHVVAPVEGSLVVRVDGIEQATLGPAQHGEIELEQGTHAVELVRGDGQVSARSVEVDDGFFEDLTPADGQCFVELDATEAYYGHAPRPEVEARHFGESSFEISSSRYFAESEMPSSIQSGSHVYLVFEVPCAMSSASDRELLIAAGYDG